MSVDYSFNKKISFDEIINKTSLKIENHNDHNWLIDEFGNHILIKEKNCVDENCNPVDPPTLEICAYGRNNSTKVRDELIKHFNVKFITDNEEELLYHEPERCENIEQMFDKVMEQYGYLINGEIIVPEREISEYKPHEPLFPQTNNENSDDNLPF